MSYYSDYGYPEYECVDFSALLGKTISAIEVNKDSDDEIKIATADGDLFVMHHEQSCCESVSIHEIVGDLEDLINTPLLQAAEETNEGSEDYGTFTWTFYKLATIKGRVTISWYGSSNGYYSESVSISRRKRDAVAA